MKSVKRFFVSKRKLSLALLYLADMLINKSKTKLNVFNYVVCFVFFWRQKNLYGVFPGLLGHCISVKYPETNGQETRSDHVTRNASAARNNET